jgi:hypothetical protein
VWRAPVAGIVATTDCAHTAWSVDARRTRVLRARVSRRPLGGDQRSATLRQLGGAICSHRSNGVDLDAYPMSDRPRGDHLVFIRRANQVTNPEGAIRLGTRRRTRVEDRRPGRPRIRGSGAWVLTLQAALPANPVPTRGCSARERDLQSRLPTVSRPPRDGLHRSLPVAFSGSAKAQKSALTCKNAETFWWRRWDSNPRPPACKAGALAS